jgi:transcription initiation factor IIE alpha subunit
MKFVSELNRLADWLKDHGEPDKEVREAIVEIEQLESAVRDCCNLFRQNYICPPESALKIMRKNQLKHGDISTCSQCGTPIQYVDAGEGYWSHQKGNPRHIAKPRI